MAIQQQTMIDLLGAYMLFYKYLTKWLKQQQTMFDVFGAYISYSINILPMKCINGEKGATPIWHMKKLLKTFCKNSYIWPVML